jgi:hypothetical protein
MMGRVKDKLLELEEANIIEWDNDRYQYVLVKDPKKNFDLAKYLFELHRQQAKIAGEYNAKK